MSDTKHYKTDGTDTRYIAASIPIVKNEIDLGNVLNIGIGYGVWDRFLNSYCTGSTSIDLNRDLVNWSHELNPLVNHICIDAFDYRPEKPHTAIICSHLLEHLEDPVSFLNLVHSWLSNDGRLVVVVPNANSIHRKLGVHMGLLKCVSELNDGDLLLGHKRVYSSDLLMEHISKSPLKLVSMRTITMKAISNAQFSSFPPEYLDACVDPYLDWGDHGGQLLAVLSR